MFNANAPLLTPELAKALSKDACIISELRLNLARFCEFLGFELSGTGAETSVKKAANFEDRVPNCWHSCNEFICSS